MSTFIAPEQVLQTGSGQCEHCFAHATRVLVRTVGNMRAWLLVDPVPKGWLAHRCPKTLKEAA